MRRVPYLLKIVNEPLYAVRREGIKPDSHKPPVVCDFLV